MTQEQLNHEVNVAASQVTQALYEGVAGAPASDVTAAIRALIQAEIASATPRILRAAGVLVKP